MSKLSDTQLVILSTACKRDDRLALPLPARVTGNAANKVVTSLLAKKLIEAVPAKPGQPVWGEGNDRKTLVVTDAAFAALGIEPDTATAEQSATPKAKAKKRLKADKAAKSDAPRAPRKDSKQAKLIAMLRRAKGATIEEIAEALGWQHHTVRGAISGALKKKLGLTVESITDHRGRSYHISE